MKKGALVSVFTVFSILLCCAGIFYLLYTTGPDENASDPQAAGSVQDTALTAGGHSDDDGSDSTDSDSGANDGSDSTDNDSGVNVGSDSTDDASGNENVDSGADDVSDNAGLDAGASDSKDSDSGANEDSDDAVSDDSASDKNDAAPKKGVFYSARKFRRRFPDTDPKLLVGKIVNIDKKETVHLRRTTSKNAYLNGRLRLGDKVSVLKLGRDWIKIKKGKKTGYIYYKYIAIALK